ncbi:MAG: hypothetical protein DRI36_01590 [Caldiserica bacterium]|nr:MAG: hypothetical protein DRI36_01590 [Caldisericota bacterium]
MFGKQEVGGFQIRFEALYDFVNSEMKDMFLLGNRWGILAFDFGFKELVSFEKVYEDKKYLERQREVSPYFTFYLKSYLPLSVGLRINSITTALQEGLSELKRDKTRNLYFLFTFKKKEEEIFNLKIENSYKTIIHGYLFTKLEFNFGFKIKMRNDLFLLFSSEFAIPFNLDEGEVVRGELYSLGGLERLKGYDYEEFRGSYKSYISTEFSFPLYRAKSRRYFGFHFEHLKGFFIVETGKTEDEFYYIRNYLSSIGVGLEYKLSFFKIFSSRMRFMITKATEKGRKPKFYLTLSNFPYKK